MRAIRISFLFFVALFTATVTLPAEAQQPVERLALGDALPRSTPYKALSGSTLRFSDFKSKKVVLAFLVPSSGDCQALAPKLEKLSQKYRAQGVAMVGVLARGRGARQFQRTYGLKFPIVIDAGLGASIVSDGYPFLAFADAGGRLRFTTRGLSLADMIPSLERAIAQP